jgi:hypothetical protein
MRSIDLHRYMYGIELGVLSDVLGHAHGLTKIYDCLSSRSPLQNAACLVDRTREKKTKIRRSLQRATWSPSTDRYFRRPSLQTVLHAAENDMRAAFCSEVRCIAP